MVEPTYMYIYIYGLHIIYLHGSIMFYVCIHTLYDTHHTYCIMLLSNMSDIVKHLSRVFAELGPYSNMLRNLMHSNLFTRTVVMQSPAQQLVESKPGSRAPDITRMTDHFCLSSAILSKHQG